MRHIFKDKEPTQEERNAAKIRKLVQGTPIVGYHDEYGQLVIPAEYDDEY